MKTTLFYLFLPFSFIYGLLLFIRNKLYDWGIFNSTSFKLPIIAIGNLNIGGVGKTPHVEYLIRLLENNQQIATLSRGYKRKTKGFVLASNNSTIIEIGDEPLQYQKKFKNLIVAVDEKRVRGVQLLKDHHPELGVVVLDDAFQHRSIKVGLNILITDYNNLFFNDYVLPAGRLREWKSGMQRAQIIIISKCDTNLNEEDKAIIINSIKPKSYQNVYFSAIKYGEIISFSVAANKLITDKIKAESALLITGIANPKPLKEHIQKQYKNIEHLNFPDHHQFNKTDTSKIKTAYKKLKGKNKIIITTEKDFMRLSLPKILNELNEIPLFYIPIEIYFLGDGKKSFDTQINKYVTTNKGN